MPAPPPARHFAGRSCSRGADQRIQRRWIHQPLLHQQGFKCLHSQSRIRRHRLVFVLVLMCVAQFGVIAVPAIAAAAVKKSRRVVVIDVP